MSERFAIGAQGAGFISFKEPITVSGTPKQDFDIPEGMICIGGNGRGYVIEEQTYTPAPALTLGDYVLYASDPVNASGDGDGIAEIDHQSYNSYINGAGHASPTKIYHGDTNSRRAFCFFSVDSSGDVIEASIRTLTSFAYEEQYDYLEKMGFFVFGKSDSDFQFRGNYWDENCTLAITTADSTFRSWETTNGVATGLLVYKENLAAWAAQAYVVGDKIVESSTGTHREWVVITGGTSSGSEPTTWNTVTTIGGTIIDTGSVVWALTGDAYGYYDVAQADNDTYPDREVVVGVADEDRDGTATGDNYVITSGLVDLGETILPNTEFPAGTYLYLTEDASHITTARPSVQTSGAADASFISAGNIVRDIDFWMNGKTYVAGDIIVDDSSPTQYVWKCTTGGVANGVSGNVPDFSGNVTPTIYEWTDAGYVGDTVVEDSGVTWTLEGEYNQQDFKGRKVRVGVSLGYGKMLFQTGAGGSANIDDHDESAMAHSDIQDAINEAGIYVYNQEQGVTDFEYRGQHFDKYANFEATVADYDLVYLKSDGVYNKAQNVVTDLHAGGVVGMALGVSAAEGTVISKGFIKYDTSSWTAGDTLYLHKTAAGTMTNSLSTGELDNIPVGKVIRSGIVSAGGYIYLNVSPSAGVTLDYVDYSVHSAQTTSGVSNYNFVYRNADGKYYQALNTLTASTTRNVVGMAYSLSSDTADIITQGFVDFDFTDGTLFDGSGLAVGDTIYLSSSNAGRCTNVKKAYGDIKLGTCIVAGDGLLYIDIDYTEDLSVQPAQTTSGVSNYDFVYRNSAGNYQQAVNDQTDLSAGEVVGLAYNLVSNTADIITQGFVSYDTTTIEGTPAVGAPIYLSYTTAGLATTVKKQTDNIRIGTIITLGAVGTGFIHVNITGDEFQDNAIDYEANFEGTVVQYDVVYGADAGGGTIEYTKAQVTGGVAQTFLGIAAEVDTTEGIVITQGYVDMGTDIVTGSGSDAGTLGYLVDAESLAVGEKVYLSSTTAGLLSKDQTTAEVGKYIGTRTIGGATHYFMLLSSTGSGGTGDVSDDDMLYNNLLSTSLFTKVYYDSFAAPSTVTTDTTYSNGLYEGTIGEYLQATILLEPTDTWVNSGTFEVDDEILEGDFVWRCIKTDTYLGTEPEPDWTNKVDDTNLEAHYTMDNVSGTTLVDETANGYDGTITNATQDTSLYKIGTASLNCVNGTGYVDCGTSMATDLGSGITEFSTSFWFRANDTSTSQALLSITDSAFGDIQCLVHTDRVRFGGKNTTPWEANLIFTDTSNKFHHFVGTYNGTTAILYIDGQLASSTTTDVPASLDFTGCTTYIGNDDNGYIFDGNIDQVRIYNEVLSAVDVRNLYREQNNDLSIGTVIEDEANVVWEAIRPNTDYRFTVHKEELGDALITAEYSMDASPSTWYPVPKFDEIILESGGFENLHVKFTWGSSGSLTSFGTLYGYDNAVLNSQVMLYEVYTQSGAGNINDLITVPNNGIYTNDGKSLHVYTAAGLKLHVNDHYEEVDRYTIKMLYALSDTDKLIFQEYYGTVDSSIENHTILIVGHDSTGQHTLENTIYTTTDNIVLTDNVIISNAAGATTLTLPQASTCDKRTFIIKNINTGVATIEGYASETIDGALTYDLDTQYESIMVYCDGSNWHLI